MRRPESEILMSLPSSTRRRSACWGSSPTKFVEHRWCVLANLPLFVFHPASSHSDVGSPQALDSRTAAAETRLEVRSHSLASTAVRSTRDFFCLTPRTPLCAFAPRAGAELAARGARERRRRRRRRRRWRGGRRRRGPRRGEGAAGGDARATEGFARCVSRLTSPIITSDARSARCVSRPMTPIITSDARPGEVRACARRRRRSKYRRSNDRPYYIVHATLRAARSQSPPGRDAEKRRGGCMSFSARASPGDRARVRVRDSTFFHRLSTINMASPTGQACKKITCRACVVGSLTRAPRGAARCWRARARPDLSCLVHRAHAQRGRRPRRAAGRTRRRARREQATKGAMWCYMVSCGVIWCHMVSCGVMPNRLAGRWDGVGRRDGARWIGRQVWWWMADW